MALRASLVITGDAASATAALGKVDAALDRNTAAAQRAAAANDDLGRKVGVSTRQAAAGYTNLGRQAQDVAVQLQSGTNIGTIIAQQGGQVADAVAMMGGRFSGLASFLAGPWGAAIIVGAGVLLNQFIPALFGASDAADEAAEGSKALASAVGDLGTFFDKTTGKIKETNAALVQFAILSRQQQIDKERSRQQEAARSGNAALDQSQRNLKPVFAERGLGRDAPATINFDVANALAGANRDEVLAAIARSSSTNAAQARQILEDRANYADAARKIAQTEKEIASLRTGVLDSSLRTGGPNKAKMVSPRKSPIGADLGEFGDDVAAKIARITDQFSDLPSAIARSNDAMRQLDDIASDVEKKKPPNYGAIEESLAGARDAIEASLTKPFDDYLEKAKQAAAIDQLILGGKREQAAALQDALALQRAQGFVTEQQLATILKTVTAERARGELLQQHQEAIGNYLDATRSVRGEVEAIFSGTGKIADLPQVIKNLQGKVLAEKLFGPMFRDLDRWVQDDSGMKDATAAYIDSTRDTAAAATDLATAFRGVGGQIRAGAVGAGSFTPTSPYGDWFDFQKAFFDTLGGAEPDTVPIDVAGQRAAKPGSLLDVTLDDYVRKLSTGLAGEITEAFDGAFGTHFFGNLTGALSSAMQGYLVGGNRYGAALGLAKGLFDEVGPGLFGDAGKKFSDKLDGAFKGLATGSQIAGLAGAFGIKLSNTGSQIGGAIGGALPIPGGAIIGSIAGGLIGNLFGSKPYGTAAITSASGKLTGFGKQGDAAAGLGGGVQQGLASIAEKLGAELGAFKVSIGTYNDSYRVSTTGYSGGKLNTKGASGVGLYSFSTEAEAVAFAISDAIADGAVTGISDRVARALRSTSDIEDALAEALKVQDLEKLIAGPLGEIGSAFVSFESQAKERLRIATAYGFDVVKIEELNAKERLKLTKELLQDQVGSLQRLIDEMTGGSLFEGSAVDQRSALLEQIAKAKAEADAGTDGAADTLARLLEQLNAVSKDIYGTTGGFAADRGFALDQARDAIAQANQRIADAQAKSDPALAQTNAALDENNDQNARLIAIGSQTNELLAGLTIGAGSDYSRLALMASTSSQ